MVQIAERAISFWQWLDDSGNIIPAATCEVRIKGTATKIAETIYAADDVDTGTLANPFTTDAAGIAKFYLTDPQRLDLFFSKSGYSSQTITMDVQKSSIVSAHALTGTDHTASGGTVDHVLKQTAATTFAWGVDPVSDKVTTLGDLLKASGADALARFAKGSALQVLRVNAAGTDLEYATPASASLGDLLDWQFARKTANESVTSSTTMQDDDHLLVPIGANHVVAALFVVFVGPGAEAGDINVGVTGPAGSTVKQGIQGLAAATVNIEGDYSAYAGGASSIGIDDIEPTIIVIHALVVNGATAGNVTLQWSQRASSATATTVQTNSYVITQRGA